MSRAHLFPRRGYSETFEIVGNPVSMESTRKLSIGSAKKASTLTTPEPTHTPNVEPTTYEENLKKQIYFLELETRYMKEKIAVQTHSRASSGGLTPPYQLSAPSTPHNQVQSHVPTSGVMHHTSQLSLPVAQADSSSTPHMLDLSAHLPASMSGTSMPSTPTAVLHTPSERGNGSACPPNFTSISPGHPPTHTGVVSRHSSMSEVACDSMYPSQASVSTHHNTSPSPSRKSSVPLATGQEMAIHGEVSAYVQGSMTPTPRSDRSSLAPSPRPPTAPIVSAEARANRNVESRDTQVEALVTPHAEVPEGPTGVVVSALTNTNVGGHGKEASAAVQVTPCSGGPNTPLKDSSPSNRTFVQKMHSAIQTHIPQYGVGVQFQSPSQAATTQTSIAELVLNGTQTTPRTTPRGHHGVPPLPASHAPSPGCLTSTDVLDHMDGEANSLVTLSENIVHLKERFIQREESHRCDIMEQHENFERAKQVCPLWMCFGTWDSVVGGNPRRGRGILPPRHCAMGGGV